MNTEREDGHALLNGNASDDDDDNLPIASLSAYPPRLKSTIASQEARYEVENARDSLESEQEEPLLMHGLVHTGHQRGSVEQTRDVEVDAEDDVGGDQVPLWGRSGGGAWAAVANMANSILGAGEP
jgi:hypothetical protein